MMIMGGGDEDGVHAHTSIYSLETKTWTEGPEMPGPRYDFCAVPLNSTHILVTGGENDQPPPNWGLKRVSSLTELLSIQYLLLDTFVLVQVARFWPQVEE